MFINILHTAKFIQLNFSRLIIVLFCLSAVSGRAQQIIKGTVFESDSISTMDLGLSIWGRMIQQSPLLKKNLMETEPGLMAVFLCLSQQ
jgi:hypothetical protein